MYDGERRSHFGRNVVLVVTLGVLAARYHVMDALNPPSIPVISGELTMPEQLSQTANGVTAAHVLTANFHDTDRKRDLPVRIYGSANVTPHPLIMFAKGRFSRVSNYDRFINQLVTQGYEVAATEFPNNDLSDQLKVEADWPEKAKDMSYVLTQLEADPQYAAHIDPHNIAVVGHSDGAAEALMMGCMPGVKDPRLKAVVSMDGADVFGAGSCSDLLLTHGTADTTQDISGSETAFTALSATKKYFAKIVGAPHYEHIMGYQKGHTEANDGIVLSFLSQELKSSGDVTAEAAQLGAAVTLLKG